MSDVSSQKLNQTLIGIQESQKKIVDEIVIPNYISKKQFENDLKVKSIK